MLTTTLNITARVWQHAGAHYCALEPGEEKTL